MGDFYSTSTSTITTLITMYMNTQTSAIDAVITKYEYTNTNNYHCHNNSWIHKLWTKSRRVCVCVTSDAGSRYRCGWLGRGVQPPRVNRGVPILTPTQKVSKMTTFRFLSLWMDGSTDRPRIQPLKESRIRNLQWVRHGCFKRVMSHE